MLKKSAFPANFRIVTLCGSKGALQAYIQVLRILPEQNGMAFVVMTHRRAERSCQLVKILSSVTSMPVQEIKNGATLLPNHVYVVPPGKDLTTDGIVFRLSPISTLYGWPDAFNIFLKSVARNTRDRAVTVILSGLADDGSAALAGLRTSGGVSFAQADALEISMPTSAVATGNIDYFCSAVDIATLVSSLPVLSLS
jgi:two-component system CheB/CheR fusion protein